MSVTVSEQKEVEKPPDGDAAYTVYRISNHGGFAGAVRPCVHLEHTVDMRVAVSKCVNAARRERIAPKEIKAFVRRATSGTYDYFLEIMDQYFEVSI